MLKSKFVIFVVSFFMFYLGFSQDTNDVKVDLDNHYREDQFYIGVTYNLLGSRPEDVKQSGFSTGFHFGFIRDIPLNKARNRAIGIGLGVSANSYIQNLLIQKDDSGNIGYTVIEDLDTFSKNKFTDYFVEVPLEFRWRTSTASTYQFWRIYTGIKFGYMLGGSTKYKGDLGSLKYSNIDDFNKFQYGLTLSAGYNTWNLHLYYGLNSIFSDDATLNNTSVDMYAIKVGLMFYIL